MAWNRSETESGANKIRVAQKKPGLSRWLIGLAVAAIGGGIVWLLLGQPQDRRKEKADKAPSLIKAATPVKAPVEKQQPKSVKVASGSDVAPAQAETVKENLPSNFFRTSFGTVEVLPRPTSHGKKGKPIFDNAVHGQIANYIRPGVSMPPPEPVSDADAMAAVIAPIVDLETDDETTLEMKECVRKMLGELKDHLADGKSANSFFRMLEQRQELEAEAVNQTRRDVLNLVREGKVSEAKETLDAYNKYLKTKGIPSVSVKQLRIKLKEQEQNKGEMR